MRIVFHFSIPQPIIAVTVAYTAIAAIGAFYVDKMAGAFLALISLNIALEALGLLDTLPRQTIGEIVWIAGVLCCGIIGPSGGIYRTKLFGSAPRNAGRSYNTLGSVAAPIKAAGEDPAG